ncbi:MAG: CBS domain-containing protein [Burkholderiales bacterium]
MKAKDIMSSPVVSVGPDTPVYEIAALLFERRISGVPVLDNGRLVGIVSEADLLHRHEIGTDCVARTGSWWLRMFDADRTMLAYVRSHARHARDIMTREVVSIMPETPLSEIATLLEAHGIRRVPVLRDGLLVGVVSRANLVQALAAKGPSVNDAASSDATIYKGLMVELARQSWWRPDYMIAYVADGTVYFKGLIDADEERDAARVAAENIPGVRGIEDCRMKFSAFPVAM